MKNVKEKAGFTAEDPLFLHSTTATQGDHL